MGEDDIFNGADNITKYSMHWQMLTRHAQDGAINKDSGIHYAKTGTNSLIVVENMIKNSEDVCVCVEDITPIELFLTKHLEKSWNSLSIITAEQSQDSLRRLEQNRQHGGKAQCQFMLLNQWLQDKDGLDAYRDNHTFITAGNMYLRWMGPAMNINDYSYNNPAETRIMHDTFWNRAEQAKITYQKKADFS